MRGGFSWVGLLGLCFWFSLVTLIHTLSWMGREDSALGEVKLGGIFVLNHIVALRE